MEDEQLTPEPPVVKQEENNNGEPPKKETGFRLNPENINRNGRPKLGAALTDMLREVLDGDPELKMRLIKQLVSQAADAGDIKAIREIFDRLDGKSVETHVVIGAEKLEEIDKTVKQILGVPDEPSNAEPSPEAL